MSPWLAAAAYPRHSPFSTLLHSLCARARNIISSLAKNRQTQRKYHCPRYIQILKTFKQFQRRRAVDAFAGQAGHGKAEVPFRMPSYRILTEMEGEWLVSQQASAPRC